MAAKAMPWVIGALKDCDTTTVSRRAVVPFVARCTDGQRNQKLLFLRGIRGMVADVQRRCEVTVRERDSLQYQSSLCLPACCRLLVGCAPQKVGA